MKIKSVSNYMAILRNLNNVLKADVSQYHIDLICAALTDPTAISRSKQYPFRYYSAYKTLQENREQYDSTKVSAVLQALEKAIAISAESVPKISGKSLVLVDVSGSMCWQPISKHSKVTPAEVAGMFGA
ncbi:MAG: TROVE domain-containing protein, partial [Candidatus Pacebacteria bacterium]|nr:TROVE domain-containing protein [Candidatus Paceibacterota bacterium]